MAAKQTRRPSTPRVRLADLVTELPATETATKIQNGDPMMINGIAVCRVVNRGLELIFCDGLGQPVHRALANATIKIDKRFA